MPRPRPSHDLHSPDAHAQAWSRAQALVALAGLGHIAAMRLRKLALVLLLAFGVSTLGCATTTIEHVWRAPDWNGSFTHVAIFGVSPLPGVRRDFETKMVAAFANVGVRASASYRLFGGDGELSDEEIARELGERGIDGAMVVRLVGVDTEYRWLDSGPYGLGVTPYGFYDYYRHSYALMYSPGYMLDYDIVVIETNLYQVANSELVWAGLSETFDPANVDEAIESYAETMVRTLVLGGLLARTITPGSIEVRD